MQASEFKIYTPNYEIVSEGYGYRIRLIGNLTLEVMQNLLCDVKLIPNHFFKDLAVLIDVTRVISCNTECYTWLQNLSRRLYRKHLHRFCFVYRNSSQQILLNIEGLAKDVPRRFVSEIAFPKWEHRVESWLYRGANIT